MSKLIDGVNMTFCHRFPLLSVHWSNNAHWHANMYHWLCAIWLASLEYFCNLIFNYKNCRDFVFLTSDKSGKPWWGGKSYAERFWINPLTIRSYGEETRDMDGGSPNLWKQVKRNPIDSNSVQRELPRQSSIHTWITAIAQVKPGASVVIYFVMEI